MGGASLIAALILARMKASHATLLTALFVIIATSGATNSSTNSSNSTDSSNSTTPTPTTATPTPTTSNTSACVYGSTSTCATRVVQEIVISSLSASNYTGNVKSTYECAYVKMVNAAWCTAASGSVSYTTGVQIQSAAARRAATITFTMDVETDVLGASAVRTAVASGASATNLRTQMSAINTATGWSVTVPAANEITVNTATFSGATSSTAVVIPSAIMVLLGSLISLFWN